MEIAAEGDSENVNQIGIDVIRRENPSLQPFVKSRESQRRVEILRPADVAPELSRGIDLGKSAAHGIDRPLGIGIRI